MWIAFKNYYLRDTTQHNNPTAEGDTCCELLSKIIIFVTRHNAIKKQNNSSNVVNCFQKLLSSWHDTTDDDLKTLFGLLWIAFKNYYLRDTTQRWFVFWCIVCCCELLSKIIIFVTRHNFTLFLLILSAVVNCFQKLLSSWHDTTKSIFKYCLLSLWIAFKNYYLRDTTQQQNLYY